MRQILSATIFLLIFSQTPAQSSEKKENIKKLFVLMGQDSLVIKTVDGMSTSMLTNMTKMFSDTAYTKMGIDVSKITQKIMDRNLQRTKENALRLINEDMVDIYDKYFTTEDITDFSKFYQTKAGQKLVTQTPAITKDLMTIMITKYQKDFQLSLANDIQEILKEINEQMKSRQN